MSGLTLPTIRPSRPRARPCFSMISRICTVRSRIASRSSSVFGRQPDHVVQLQVVHPAAEDEFGGVEDLLVGHGLVDDATQPVGSGFRRDRDRLLAAAAQQVDDRRVRSSRRSDAGLIE